jgi:ATPase subunit of ABC transporter with duplicated ATPase domains
MIKIDNISKQFGDKMVLNNISFVLGNNEIVGLVGNNGTGKTTIVNIILQELEPENGKVTIQNEIIGYLPQKLQFPINISGERFLLHKMGEEEKYNIKKIIKMVGLSYSDLNTEANSLSGGQKTRLWLASLLTNPKPTALLLDEPTNNLDIEGIKWLEEFLTKFRGIVLLISHDRALLDNLAEKIIELENGKIKIYGGNYSFYHQQKEAEKEAYERMYFIQQKKIIQIKKNIKYIQEKTRIGEQQFSSRMPYQRRKIRKSAEQASSRKIKLEKFLKSEKRLKQPEKPITYSINLSGKTHSDKTLLSVKNLSKSFNHKKILNAVSFNVYGNEKVWLAGLNGCGKTTLLKIVSRELTEDSGTIQYGNDVSVGYFSQEQQDDNPKNTILDELRNIGIHSTEAYKLAMTYYFKREELTKQIKELSLGQKTKLAFAKLTTGNYQLLILDEPTNHLEIKTREILEQALFNYQGGILVSSHDRYFLENIGINKIITLKNGKLISEFTA